MATGGVERVALELLKFEARRRDVCFVGEQTSEADLPHAVVHPRSVPRSLQPWAFKRAASSVLSELRPRATLSLGANCPAGDILWVQSVHAAWLADGGEILLKGRAVPPAVRRLLLRHQVLLALEKDYFTRSRPRAVLCTSQREVDDLRRFYDVAPELLHIAPNGYDGAAFSAERRRAERDEMRQHIGASSEDKVVLLVANEWHRKGLGPLIRAVKMLDDASVRIDLVGSKSPADYLGLAASLGLGERVFWHGASADVMRYYAAADVFALPTVYEPFGIVIVEALAAGLPVVTSALAGAASAIHDGVDGFLLQNPRDAEEVSDALRHALDADSDFEQRAVEAAKPFEWAAVLDRVDGIIFG